MGLKNILRNSSNNTYNKNKDLLEKHDLVSVMGNPVKPFLKFLKSKNISIDEDEITEELIEEYEGSLDFLELKPVKTKKLKETIFKQRKVWINICPEDEWQGTDLILQHDGIIIEKTNQKILYSRMIDIEISDGGWSKNKVSITTLDGEMTFAVNENYAKPLKEILEDNMDKETYDEIDDLLELYELYEAGLLTQEEYESKKDEIYRDNVYCINCGAKLEEGADFCTNCGSKIMD